MDSKSLSHAAFSTSMGAERLFHFAQDFQQEIRYLKQQNKHLSAVAMMRNRPTWTRAEPELPGEKQYRFCGLFGTPKTTVLVYDLKNETLSAQQINEVKGMLV